MKIVNGIRGLYKSVCVGPAWHGPSLDENLKDVTAEQAASHPIAGAHSIWELVRHISAWEQKVARVLTTGEECNTMLGDDDWPPVTDTSAEAWQAALIELAEGRKALAAAMKAFPEEKLSEMVPTREFSWFVLLEGMTHHSLYHSGQIALLKKAAC